MSKNIWYLPGPFHRYAEDVRALARDANVVIVDSTLTDSRDGAAKEVPKATLKPQFGGKAAEASPAGKPSDGLTVEQLTEELTAKGIEVPAGAKKADLQKLLDGAA